MAPTLSSDEALARALQEAYEDEFRQSSSRQLQQMQQQQQQQQQRPPPTAPPASFADRHSSIEVSDAAYARRMEREMRQEGAFGAPAALASGARPNTMGSTVNNNNNNDDEYARRMEQEIYDEEVARRISTQEEQRASQHRANVMAAQEPARRACSVRRVCAYLVPLAVVGGIAAGLLFVFNNPDSLGFLPDFQDFANEDPFNQTGPEEADRWRSGGKGLELEVVNALDDSWYEFFYKAINEWDAGSPDVLTLTTSVRSPDPDCTTLNGKMKVCNDDYGDTRWRGINQVLIRNGFIFASTAKMNEFYLKKSGNPQKQYTMCHEIGHGFGLPHTDINFFNADTGECMDYTDNPENNDQPGVDNFEFLQSMYGNVAGDDSAAAAAASTVPGERKMSVVNDANEALPDWLDFKLQEIMPGLENRVDGNEHEDGWQLLHRSLHGAGHEMDLGDGYSVQVHKLLVSELE